MQNGSAYDVLLVGGGQASVPLSYRLAGAGFTVALAERRDLGGSCVNFGCTPTKAAIASARLAYGARRAAEFGLRIPEVTVDFPAVLERARSMAESKRLGLEKGFANTGNPELIYGHARFVDREEAGFRLRVGDRSVRARQVVINTGTRALVPAISGLREVGFIHSGNWLERTELPERLLVVGGSYIGLEMAQFYRRMGSRVTVVVGNSERVTTREDEDVSGALRAILEEEGVSFVFCERAESVRAVDGGVALALSGGERAEVRGSHLFVAAGRKPNTDDLGLDSVGLETKGGIIEVDERLATAVEGIWASGDVRGGPMFTHTSYDDHRILLSQLAGDGSRTTDRVVPYAIFTDPELGRVGMTEREAREAGYEVRVSRFDIGSAKGKAMMIGETRGFIKVVADAVTDRILGAAVLSAEGAELVHAYVDLMNAGAPLGALREAIHIHPTLAEDIQSAAF